MNRDNVLTQGMVNNYLDIVTTLDGRPLALLVPEDAGRQTYALMATALKQMEGQTYDLAVLVTTSPSNQGYFQTKGKLITPLGALEVDQTAARAVEGKNPELSPIELDKTQQSDAIVNSFPVLLLFLKQVMPNIKVLPVLVPENALDLALSLGKSLAEMNTNHQTVVIVQTNLDQTLMTALEYNDPEIFAQAANLIELQQIEKKELPGINGASAAMALGYAYSSGGNTVTILQEHRRQHLNQAAVMLWDYQPPQLTEDQKNELQRLASQAIENYVREGFIPNFQTDDPVLNRKAGVFVTLRIKGLLRGCIGHMSAEKPLAQAVQEMAVAAATSDPRFPPLTNKEISQITAKIAILSPMKRISPRQVEVGRHGLLISHGGRRGVLLPEVAVERNWDRETFLENLCRKAGLPEDAWRQNPTLYGFTSVVFGNE
jgi:AmmeMemoRadiSam system protein A/AmmeMemoRadiSam system protein B